MANRGSFLMAPQFLAVGDYLVSNNKLFFAIMQQDGNFCVYLGSGPEDNKGGVWCCANQSLPLGEYFAVMQGDGNFCVYKGPGPNDARGLVWARSNQSLPIVPYFAVMQDDGNFCVYKGLGPDRILEGLWCTDSVDHVDILSIDYDLESVSKPESQPFELYRQSVSNTTGTTQSSTINGSESVAETSSWTSATAVKLGTSTTFKTGIPFIVDGEVTVSLEVTETFTWNGTQTRTKTWGFTTPIVVPSMTSLEVTVVTTLSKISVSYVLKGVVVLKSGLRIPFTYNGKYTGTNSHGLTANFAKQKIGSKKITSVTKEIEEVENV